MLGGFGGGDVDEGLQIGRIGRGLLVLLSELALQDLDLAGAVGCRGLRGLRPLAVLGGFGG